MLSRRFLIALAVTLGGLNTTSWATEKLTLTLERARELARLQNPAVRATVQTVASALAQKGEAQAARLPTLFLSGRYARLSDVPPSSVTVPPNTPGMPPGGVSIPLAPTILNSYNVTATMSAPVFTGFRLENRVKVTDHLAQAAAQDLGAKEAEVLLTIDQAYWQLYSARAAARTISESVRLVEAHLADVRRMRAVGLTTDDDVLQVEVRLSQARLREIQSEHLAQMAQAALANALSLPLEMEIALADSPTVIPRAVPSQDSLERLAMGNRPELRALDERLAALDRQVAIVRGGRLPNVMVQANYEYSNPNQRYFPTEEKWHGTWNVGVGLSWTFWDWGVVRNQTNRARADLGQTDELARQLREGVALQVVQSRLGVVQAARRIAVAQDGVRQAREHYRNMKVRFEVGTASNTEVLDAEVALERAQLDLIQALADQQISWAKLDYAVGTKISGSTE